MDISSISGAVAASGAPAAKTLGKDDFMMLLLKQLSYQDPLNPMDSTAFTTQLSQFTSLEELSNINKTLEDVLAFQHSMQNAQVTNLIGKTVGISGNSTYLKDTADINYSLLGDAASVSLTVIDGSGMQVWSDQAGAQTAGEHNYLWSGSDSQGTQLPEGAYTFEIEAYDDAGNPVPVMTSSSGTVTGINFDDGIAYLVLNGGRTASLNEIKTVQ